MLYLGMTFDELQAQPAWVVEYAEIRRREQGALEAYHRRQAEKGTR